jgi:SnoaL-like domain
MGIHKSWWAIIQPTLILAAVLVVALPGLGSAQRAPALSALDYAQLEQLVHRLHFALDYCTNGGRDFADLFVPGGQYILDEGDGKPRAFDTRAKLIELAGGPECQAVRAPPRSYIAHVAENLVIDPAPGGARGMSYAIYPATHGKYFKDEFAGQVGLYFDEYMHTAAGWRFKSRRHVPNFEREKAPPISK